MNDNKPCHPFDPFDNPRSRELLDIAGKIRADFVAETDPANKQRLARFLIRSMSTTLEAMVGEDVVTAACPKPSTEAPRAEHLKAMEARLDMVAPFFDYIDNWQDRHSLRAASDELHYMVQGNRAVLFAEFPKVGKYKNTPRLLEHWIRALEWVEFLGIASTTKGECKDLVAQVFGISRDSLDKLAAQCREHLGDRVDDRLRQAREGKGVFIFRTETDAWDRMRADGDAYLRESGHANPENRVLHFPGGYRSPSS